MSGRIVEEVKGKKYKIIIEAGKDPKTGNRKRIIRRFTGRKPDAEREMANIIRDLEQGTYIEPSKTTLREYLQYWLDNYAATNLAPSTFASYNRIVNSHIVPELGRVELMKLVPTQIQSYYTKKLQDGRKDKKEGGLSARTVQYHHRVLREALQHAMKWQMIIRNPADATEPPKPEKSAIHPLTPDQLDKLLEVADGHRDKWLIMFAAYSGMRQGEILALTWPAVDIEGREPFARVQQTVGYINGKGFVFRPIGKSKKSLREIALTDMAVTALKQQSKLQAADKLKTPPTETYEDTGLIFATDRGKPIDPSGLTRRFKALLVKAGFPDARFHDLRHSFATMLLSQGIHPRVAQEILGHETISITMDTYSHVIKGMQKEAMQKINDFVKNKNGHQTGTKTQKDHP